MNTRTVLELPISDSGCGGIRVSSSSLNLRVEYEYFSEELKKDLVGSFRLLGVTAYRFRNEMHSAGFSEGSYDNLVEIIESEWTQELLSIEPSGIWGSVEHKRHFAVLFSSNGYLEVIADGFEELPWREGRLEPEGTADSST